RCGLPVHSRPPRPSGPPHDPERRPARRRRLAERADRSVTCALCAPPYPDGRAIRRRGGGETVDTGGVGTGTAVLPPHPVRHAAVRRTLDPGDIDDAARRLTVHTVADVADALDAVAVAAVGLDACAGPTGEDPIAIPNPVGKKGEA